MALFTILGELQAFADPKVHELAGEATKAANDMVDGLQNLAADLAEATR